MQNKENLHLMSDIPLLTWHLPNKGQDIIEEAENHLLKKVNNKSNSNKNENKENIPFRCHVKSSSCPTDSEFTNPNEENSDNRRKNVQQRHDYLSEDEITKIGERLNHSLRMRNSNNDSTASQKANYNLRDRKKEIKCTGVKTKTSTSSQQIQRKRANKRKLPSDFSEDSFCSKKGRKRLHTLTENSLEMGPSISSSAQKLKCSFMEMETTLNEVNLLIVNWIKGICDPLEKHEALTILHTVQNIYETLRCKKEMIKFDKTLGKKKPLQQYVNKLLKDSEHLHKKITDIIYECDMKHLKFTESKKENEVLLKNVSTKRPSSSKPTKNTTKNIKSILKKSNNHFKKSKKLSFSKKYINIYDDNTMSQRSLDADQDICLEEDSYISNSNDMDLEEIDEVLEESIDINYGNKVQDFNSDKKLLVNESCLKENTQLAIVNERAELTPTIMKQNLFNKEIDAFPDNISYQLLQNPSSSQASNTENTKSPGKSLTFNLPDYLIDYDQSLSLTSSISNLIQTEQSKLEMSPQEENGKLCDNTSEHSQLLTSIEQIQGNNINLQESCAIKSRNSKENKEKQLNSDLSMNTVQIEKPERFNEKTEFLPEKPLDTDDLKIPVLERNPNSGSTNIYNQIAIASISENSSNVTVNNNNNNNAIFNASNSQINTQKYTNKVTELLTQNSLATNSLNAPGPQINLINSNQNVIENYNQPAIKDISENNSKLIFANNNSAVNRNICQKKHQVRPKAKILLQDSFNTHSLKAPDPHRKIIHRSLNISQTSARPTISDTLNYKLNPVMASNKTIHNPNTSHFDLNTTQLQKPDQLKETMDLHHQDSLSTDTLKPTCSQRYPKSNTYDIKSSVTQPKKGKCFIKNQASRKEFVQQKINISNLEKNNMSLDKGMFLCTQCTLCSQNVNNSDPIFNHEMNSEQNPNNSNNIKISTNFKTYKRKRINKSVNGEIGSEISQQNYKQIPLAINQNSNHFTLQKPTFDNSIHDKLIHLKNYSKIINASSEKIDMMDTLSGLLLTEPSLSLSQPIKSTESTIKDVDSCENNNDKNLSSEPKSPVNYVQNYPLFSPVGSIPNVNTQILNSEIKKINNNEQTISTNSNDNNTVINMNGTEDRKYNMKNQEFLRCSENLLNSDINTNSGQEKIQSSCSEIIPATFEGIKSMRIKSKDEFVIIQDLHDLITADEFIW